MRSPGSTDALADLEVGLHRRGEASWSVELRFSSPAEETDRLTSGPAELDLPRLAGLRFGGPLVTKEYGQTLTEGLFSSPDVRADFASARTAAARDGLPLRIRLLVAPSATELHPLRWETLLDPEDGSSLLTDSNVLFSRYLTSSDWRPVRMRLKAELRALVIVADPAELERYGEPGATPDAPRRELDPVDAEGELQRARSALDPIRTETLPGSRRVTLSNVVAALRDSYDVLYLVCHGYLVNGEPQLVLEHDDGTANLVSGHLLVQRLKELQHLPRLVVLASCQSASDGGRTKDGGALAAIGPQLVEIGVPAVLAMQGDITMATVEAFVPAFFERLQDHGRIDQAMTEARAEIRDRSDWWAPTLFMRLHSGRLWYKAGFGGTGPFLKWPALINDIRQGECLPLLGPGMTDVLLGPRQQLARELADRHRFPLAPYYREDLPQVAQFLAIDQALNFPVAALRDYLLAKLSTRLRELCDQAGQPMPERFADGPTGPRTNAMLDDLISEVWNHLHADLADPFAVLARLPVRAYVTAQPMSLLSTALRAVGRSPKVEVTRWNPMCPPSIFDEQPDYEPSVEEPLVFHIFGSLQHPGSVVLREDQYFEFLRTTGRDQYAIPSYVKRAFADNALLFLGFRMEDWDFRVLFHSIMSQEGVVRLAQHSHVAAQIDPEEGLTLEPEGARRYFESYFRKPHDVNVYWGNVEGFLTELHSRVTGGR